MLLMHGGPDMALRGGRELGAAPPRYFAACMHACKLAAVAEGRQADTAASANESAWPISTQSAWTVGIPASKKKYETAPGSQTGSGYEQLESNSGLGSEVCS